MSRSYKHNPGCCCTSTGHCHKSLARRRERRTALDTIGYLSEPDGDPLITCSKRRFARMYSSWEIHDGEYLMFRKYVERDYDLIARGIDELPFCFWPTITYKQYMYLNWARSCYWK